MNWGERPVILLGHGVRLANAVGLAKRVLDLGIPVLTSWPAADCVDSDHPNYFGRPGAYGQRCANKVLGNADFVLSIGCRMSVLTVGYDFPRPGQRVFAVDIDPAEATRLPGCEGLVADAYTFMADLTAPPCPADWGAQCRQWRYELPWLESPHHDHGAYINPHRFMAELQPYLRPDEVIVADCCSGSLAAHQMLRLKPPQRLMISGGLGEMGSGLPGAIGAAFATGQRVICLNTDGGMMLNLQELQTIAHHNLPVKIIVFSNDGYGMIRDTQRNFGLQYSGVHAASGVSCPDFTFVADAFQISSLRWRTNEDFFDVDLSLMLDNPGPALLQVDIDPAYHWGPKLRPGKNPDGSIKHAVFSEMSP